MPQKILLSIAGFDPSGGAGVLLDLKVFQSLGFRGMAVLTSITAQNTERVARVRGLSPRLMLDQYLALAEDVAIAGIKVGMLGSGRNIAPLSQILDANPKIPIVVDPVLKATSGARLMEKKAFGRLIREIGGRATILTPNLTEAVLISGGKIRTVEDMMFAAGRIYGLTGTPCFIKGGHFPGKPADLLYDGRDYVFFKRKKIFKSVHGTGCFLASAILGFLAQGKSLKSAVFLAGRLTHEAIARAVRIGRGRHIISFPLREDLSD